jgi:hypothetical protein
MGLPLGLKGRLLGNAMGDMGGERLLNRFGGGANHAAALSLDLHRSPEFDPADPKPFPEDKIDQSWGD